MSDLKRIWLQTLPGGERTWCDHRVSDEDSEYILADTEDVVLSREQAGEIAELLRHYLDSVVEWAWHDDWRSRTRERVNELLVRLTGESVNVHVDNPGPSVNPEVDG